MSNKNTNTINNDAEQQTAVAVNNLRIYEQGRKVPETAQKPISAGDLKGFTDINPVWRIKKLTELFGPVGEGWYFEKIAENTISLVDGRVIYTIDINLFYKMENGEWSKPVFGTGGGTFVCFRYEKLYLDDDAKKKALTDALSVACKELGIGADIYWDKDETKYGASADFAPVQLPTPTTASNQPTNSPTMVEQMSDIMGEDNNFNVAQNAVADAIKEAQKQATVNVKSIAIDPATAPVPTVQEAEGYVIEGRGKYTGKTVGELFRLVCSCDAQAQGWLNWLLDNPQQTENMAKAQFYARFLVSYYQQNAGQTNNA